MSMLLAVSDPSSEDLDLLLPNAFSKRNEINNQRTITKYQLSVLLSFRDLLSSADKSLLVSAFPRLRINFGSLRLFFVFVENTSESVVLLGLTRSKFFDFLQKSHLYRENKVQESNFLPKESPKVRSENFPLLS